MKKDLVELVFILDRSGSMSGLEQDTIGGFNSLISKQKKEEGEAIVSTVLFSDQINVIHDRINIKEIGKLTSNEYYVSGCTALLDAVGTTINHIIHVHKNLIEENRPEKTLFIITTDGLENSSTEYNYKRVKELIEKSKKEFNYEYIFIGANIDSEEEAVKLGIDHEQAVSYKNDSIGVETNYGAINYAIKSIRKEKRLSSGWRDSIDSDYKNRRSNS